MQRQLAPPLIISVVGYKGGIGKTTTAIHLAAFFQTKASTLFIDADENRSAQSWARPGRLPFQVASETKAPQLVMKLQPEHMVIDTKARPSPADLQEISESSDLLVLPTTPRPMDFEVLIKTIQEIEHHKTPYKVLLTMVPPTSTQISAELKEVLAEEEAPVFSNVIFKYSFVGQLPLEGILAKDSSDRNAKRIWDQYMRVGKEMMK